MVKSSLIFAPVSLVLVALAALLNNICCGCGPLVAVLLGAGAGFVSAVFERPATRDAAAARGALAGLIAGVAAMLGESIGVGISQYVAYLGTGMQACIPGLCELASTPVGAAGQIIGPLFYSCFCGLMMVFPMALFGGLGGMLWSGTLGKKSEPGTTAGIETTAK